MGNLFLALASIVAGKVAGKIQSDSENEVSAKQLARLYGPSNSISKMAKSAIHLYPTLVSQSVLTSGDPSIGFSITKHLEAQFAIFTLLAIGLEPEVGKESVKDHLMRFSTESTGDDGLNGGLKFVISNVTSQEAAEFHNEIKRHPELFEVYQYSQEAIARTKRDGEDISLLFHDEHREEELDKREKTLDERDKSIDVIIKELKEAKSETGAKNARMEKQLSELAPMVISLQLVLKTGNTLNIQLGIKASAHVITSEEVVHILDRAMNNRPFVTLVQLQTGEKSLFKDIIFQVKEAETDKNLADKLGRHPFFRQMSMRKMERRMKGFINLASAGKLFSTDTLPTYSMVITKAEIERSLVLPYESLIRNNGAKLKKMMEDLMMISVVIYDTERETVDFLFHGFERLETIDVAALKRKGAGDPTTEMTKIIADLARKV